MNDTPVGWVFIIALGSGLVGAVISSLINRFTTLRSVELSNKNALDIAKANNEHSLALSRQNAEAVRKTEYARRRQELIKEISERFGVASDQFRDRAYHSITINRTPKSKTTECEIHQGELDKIPDIFILDRQINGLLSLAKLARLPTVVEGILSYSKVKKRFTSLMAKAYEEAQERGVAGESIEKEHVLLGVQHSVAVDRLLSLLAEAYEAGD